MPTNPLTAAHPIAQTLSRVVAMDENFYADFGALETGWFPAIDLLREDKPALDEALFRQAIHYPKMEARTRGSYLIGEYSWCVPAVAVTAYMAERRVPDLSLENLALRFNKYMWRYGEETGEGERIEVRFLSGRFAALPDDTDAQHPDAIILPDEVALREWLRDKLENHLTPLIERISVRTRLGRHAQWCVVADNCAALFLSGGELIKDQARGTAEGLAFVKAEGSPMKKSQTDFVSLQYLDHRETFRTRGGCCRYYTVAEDGYKCTNCMLRPADEQHQFLLEYMSQKYAKDTAS